MKPPMERKPKAGTSGSAIPSNSEKKTVKIVNQGSAGLGTGSRLAAKNAASAPSASSTPKGGIGPKMSAAGKVEGDPNNIK